MVNRHLMNKLFSTTLRALLLFSVFFSATLLAANITVTTSRNPVALDDSFHLVYEADSSVDDDPDFEPIYKNFDVLNSSQSTNMRSVNGNWSMKKTWDLSLIAKDIGKFTIPAIAFGKDTSPAIRITVTNSSSSNSVSPDGQSSIPAKIFLESSLDKKSGWVQSQFIYTVRLLRTVSIASASLTEPDTNDPDAIIHNIGEDNYQTTRNGIRYEVIERRYAIFPQKSGLLKVNPVTFEGRINATQARTIFDRFRMSGQLKRLRSPSVSATVNAAPATINLQDWLPASELQLIEEWSDDIQNIKTGDPITRTITIVAQGLTAVQLPDIKFTDIDGIKQYPDKAVTEDRKEANGITGLKQFKVALIPTKAGSYKLPEIKLQWWNTKTNKKEIANIPGKILNAVGGTNNTSANNNIAAPEPAKTTAVKTENDTNNINDQPALVNVENNATYWQWLALLFAFFWLITLALLFKKAKPETVINKPDATLLPVKQAYAAVTKYAASNDAGNTRNALIEWAKTAYNQPQINNLTQICEHCSPQLVPLIRQLNQSLYSQEHLSWDGKKLLHTFKAEPITGKPKKKDAALKPLYNH